MRRAPCRRRLRTKVQPLGNHHHADPVSQPAGQRRRRLSAVPASECHSRQPAHARVLAAYNPTLIAGRDRRWGNRHGVGSAVDADIQGTRHVRIVRRRPVEKTGVHQADAAGLAGAKLALAKRFLGDLCADRTGEFVIVPETVDLAFMSAGPDSSGPFSSVTSSTIRSAVIRSSLVCGVNGKSCATSPPSPRPAAWN